MWLWGSGSRRTGTFKYLNTSHMQDVGGFQFTSQSVAKISKIIDSGDTLDGITI